MTTIKFYKVLVGSPKEIKEKALGLGPMSFPPWLDN